MKGATGLQSWTERINRLRSVPLVLCGNEKTPPSGEVLIWVGENHLQNSHHERNINPFSDKSKLFVVIVLR